MTDVRASLAAHRPDLLRHCYRMLGSFADAEDTVQDVLLNAWKAIDSYAGTVPLGHWLMRIATNACLNELARKRRRGLPTEREPSSGLGALEELEAADWLTPAPDSQLFAPPAQVLEARESVALAFLALLQRLPPRQRAMLLLKDVVGWSADEIASTLDLTVSSVNSALHRARETIASPREPIAPSEPAPDALRAYIRSWEAHDIDSLVALLREDIEFAMPPWATWFRGRVELERFLRGPRFTERWTQGFRVIETRANGQVALAFYLRDDDHYVPHSIQLVRFDGDKVAEVITFIGAAYFRGFDLPARA